MIGQTYPGTTTQIGGWTGGDFAYAGLVSSDDYNLYAAVPAILTQLAEGADPDEGRYELTVSQNDPVAPGPETFGILDVSLYDNKLKKNVTGATVTYTVHTGAKLYFLDQTKHHLTTITKKSPNTSVSVYASAAVPNDGSWSVDITVTWPDGSTTSKNVVISPPQ
jgi:hypothetical protein